MTLWQAIEGRWRNVILATLALAGTAFVVAIVALALVLLR